MRDTDRHNITADGKRELSVENLKPLNSFYTRQDARQIVYDLYGGKCQATGEKISFRQAHVAHIVPRSRADYFQALYPGLDVDNLVNLHLLSCHHNLRNSNFFIESPLAIHNAISYSARVIKQRLNKVLKPAEYLSNHDLNAFIDNLGVPVKFDFSDVFSKAIDRKSYFALPLEEINNIIQITKNINSISCWLYYGHLFKYYMVCTPYSDIHSSLSAKYLVPQSGNNDQPGWVSKAKYDLSHPERRKKNLPDGEWLILEGKPADHDPEITLKFFTEKEKIILVVNDIRVMTDEMLDDTSKNMKLIHVKDAPYCNWRGNIRIDNKLAHV